LRFVQADIRIDMPQGIFDKIVWDAAIEHFTEEEITGIIRSIKSRLAPDGIVSGHTVVERQDGTKQLSHHEYEFGDKKDLLRFLAPYFRNAMVFETKHADRHNLYFWASDGPVPFSADWPSMCNTWTSES